MILQKQYSMWKVLNILLWVVLLVIAWLYFFFEYSIWAKKAEISQKHEELTTVKSELNRVKSEPIYRSYQLASVIKSKENNTNYYFLYRYLKRIKLDIQAALKQEDIDSDNFTLAVDKNKVNITATVPNYNFIYESGSWILDKLQSKSFVEKISINSYKTSKSKDWSFSRKSPISFDLKLETK